MLQTEFLRSIHANYERVLLEEKPEERRYQYCILNRGGIKGLLPCSLRYMNGSAYLYYDITSKQNVAQVYDNRSINREWMKNFLWSLKQIRMELARFLLDIQNVIWYPEHIFQDLDNSIFSFLYIPYYQGEDSFRGLLEYFIDRVDYEDELLVETVYKMYDHYEKIGYDYLQGQIFEDAKVLEKEYNAEQVSVEKGEIESEEQIVKPIQLAEHTPMTVSERTDRPLDEEDVLDRQEKRGFRSLFEPKKKRTKSENNSYQKELQLSMSSYAPMGYKVAEEEDFEEEYGQTIYIAETEETLDKPRRLYTTEGRIVVQQLDKPSCTIGKKKGEVEVVLDDASISRMHARIVKEQDAFFVEDLNSTNGTFKNGLRMQPYEKRKLEEGDEIRLGKITLIFR